jgi:hypothetical protein
MTQDLFMICGWFLYTGLVLMLIIRNHGGSDRKAKLWLSFAILLSGAAIPWAIDRGIDQGIWAEYSALYIAGIIKFLSITLFPAIGGGLFANAVSTKSE